MILNTEVLQDLSKKVLKQYAAALTDYIESRPFHRFGLCYWLKNDNKIGLDGGDDCPYHVVSQLRNDTAGTYIGGERGFSEERVEFAKAFAWAIAAELKRREQPKAPRKPTINLKKASLQRIFEFGLRHGRKQGKQCVNSEGVCKMRGPNGMACIVGSMIDDELARRCDDGESDDHVVSSPDVKYAPWVEVIGKGRLAERKAELLCSMQSAHDDAYCDFSSEFEDRMATVANDYGLIYKPVGVTLRA
jgi:hypothetical protein